MQFGQLTEEGPIQYITRVSVDEPANKKFRRTTARVEFVEELFAITKARYLFVEGGIQIALPLFWKAQAPVGGVAMSFEERARWSDAAITCLPLNLRFYADFLADVARIHRRMPQPQRDLEPCVSHYGASAIST